MPSEFLDVAEAARRLHKTDAAVRCVIQRLPTGKLPFGRTRVLVDLEALRHAYTAEVQDRGW